MEQTFRFKTNLKCNGCIAKIKPLLDVHPMVIQWSVDLTLPDRVLTVVLKSAEPDLIIKILQGTGYTAEKITL